MSGTGKSTGVKKTKKKEAGEGVPSNYVAFIQVTNIPVISKLFDPTRKKHIRKEKKKHVARKLPAVWQGTPAHLTICDSS